MARQRRTSLFRYWTTRYLLTLCVGLLVIGIASTMWIRYSEAKNRLDIMRLMAAEIAERIVDADGQIRMAPFLSRILDSRQESLRLSYKPYLLILNERRELLFDRPGQFPPELKRLVADLVEAEKEMTEVQLDSGEKLLFVKQMIQVNGEEKGWVLLFSRDVNLAADTTQFQLLLIMLGSLGLLGWLVIYLLTKRLARPIRDVSDAAKQIVQGNYDIRLDQDRPEREIHELNQSFREMADRLRQLERMRNELLAGVTHELKTPVTSISGLVQAVKDEVVTGEEAREFLHICARETQRLQKMVEDLLDFNSFAVGAIRINRERRNMNGLVKEIVHQWRIAQEDASLAVEVQTPEQPVFACIDPLRVQQILYNLLNNAAQAIDGGGRIGVTLQEKENKIVIEVSDNGRGIPEEEQPLIFERFFRGERNRQTRRGLGLGLSFSRMMAQALDGNLVLRESSSSGSVFSLILRKEREKDDAGSAKDGMR